MPSSLRAPDPDTYADDVLCTPFRYRKEMLVFLQTGLSCCEGLPEGLQAAIQKWIDDKLPGVEEALKVSAAVKKAFESVDTWVIVNGKKHQVAQTESISYEEVVRLSGFHNGLYTVTYRSHKGDGSLVPGQSTALVPAMIFNIAHTGAA